MKEAQHAQKIQVALERRMRFTDDIYGSNKESKKTTTGFQVFKEGKDYI